MVYAKLNSDASLFSHDKMTFKAAEIIEPSIEIVNVVASATLRERVDLDAVAKVFVNARYPLPRFPGLVFRLKKPKTATLIFGSGKMICTGAKSEREATRAVLKVVKDLRRRGLIIASAAEIKIANIVASAGLGREVDFEALVSMLQNVTYEPGQFPALIYRMEDPKVVFLVFSSGRLVCSGAKTEEEVHRAVSKLQGKLNAIYASPSSNRLHEDNEMKCLELLPLSPVNLAEFVFSGSGGKACTYVRGLWCHNESCNGHSCRFADLIRERLEDGFYGCWGFHWQRGWYTADTKKAQRKFVNHISAS